MQANSHICNEKYSWALDNWLRKIIQPPEKILNGYIKEGMKVIDLGCGPGFLTIPIAQKTGDSGKVTAVDIQAGMLIRIKKKIQGTVLENRIILHQCSANGINLFGKYDFTIAFYMIHEVPDNKKIFKEIFDLLNIEGKFLIVEPKGHVNKASFTETIEIAKQIGFIVDEEPKVAFSRAVLLSKNKAQV